MKKIAISHGTLVTGDGETTIDDSLVLIGFGSIEYAGEYINAIGKDVYHEIDASGMIVMPGIINAHAHGIIPNAPLFSSGSCPLDYRQVKENLKKHLSEGTTSILNVDGFADIEDVLKADRENPMHIRTAITHFPKSYAAARKIDGSGIKKEFDYSESLEKYSGIVAGFGECGSGATLGGGVQDYKFIPEMVEREYGVMVSEHAARQLKEAVLGKYIDENLFDSEKLESLLCANGLDVLCEDIRQKIVDCVMPCFRLSLESIREAAAATAAYYLPMIVHSAAASMNVLDEIMKEDKYNNRVVAGHSNHPSYDLGEAIEFAMRLKKRGAIIDVSTFDTLNTGNKKELECFMLFLESGLADIVSTDYGRGNHCSILSMLDIAVKGNVVSLPRAVQTATYNPAKVFSAFGRERGLIEEGYSADVIVTDEKNLSDVSYVMIDGQLVKEN